MRRKFVAGNWKMNGSANSIRELLQGIREGAAEVAAVELAVFPSFVYLGLVAAAISRWSAGARRICPSMLRGAHWRSGGFDVCGIFIATTSSSVTRAAHLVRRNRRDRRAEVCHPPPSDWTQAHPLRRRTLQEREQGVTEAVVERQIKAVLDLEGISGFADAVIAYEPVWAIGTGRTATTGQAQEVHAFIRAKVGATGFGAGEPGPHSVRRQHESRQCRGAAGHAGYRRRFDRRRFARS